MTTLIENLKSIQVDQNSAYDYIIALLIFASLLAALKIFQLIILARLKNLAQKTKTDFDDVLIKIFSELKPSVYLLVSLYLATRSILVTPLISQIINIFFVVAVVYEAVQAAGKIIDWLIHKYLNRGNGQKSGPMVRTVSGLAKIILWAIGIILVLSNLGVNVTSVVASLGIGGLAIALALQNILTDVFSSFSIYVDKPFREGDFIVVGSDMGTVKKIGLKSTRITTLQGEELIISNRELTSARVQNYKKMEKRRVTFSLGVTYDTKPEKLEKIPAIIKEIINQTPNAEFNRCHFSSYGDFSLNFETVFYVNSGDYNVYMDAKEKINLEIYKRFSREKIEFAFPTQTIFLNK